MRSKSGWRALSLCQNGLEYLKCLKRLELLLAAEALQALQAAHSEVQLEIGLLLPLLH